MVDKQTKLKAFADDKIHVTQKLKIVFRMVGNIVGKRENAGYQHFLPFPQCFQTASFSASLSQDCVVKSQIVTFKCFHFGSA